MTIYRPNTGDSPNSPPPAKHRKFPCDFGMPDQRKEYAKNNSERVKSDGGKTSYYELPDHASELRHLISHKGMSKARGDIFKACYRMGEKSGSSILYDLNKIKDELEALYGMLERGEHI